MSGTGISGIAGEEIRMVTRSQSRKVRHVEEVVGEAKRRVQASANSPGRKRQISGGDNSARKRRSKSERTNPSATPTGLRLNAELGSDLGQAVLELIPSMYGDILLSAPLEDETREEAISATINRWENLLLDIGNAEGYDPWVLSLPGCAKRSKKSAADSATTSFAERLNLLVRYHYGSPTGVDNCTVLDAVITTFLTMHPEIMDDLISPFVQLLDGLEGDRLAELGPGETVVAQLVPARTTAVPLFAALYQLFRPGEREGSVLGSICACQRGFVQSISVHHFQASSEHRDQKSRHLAAWIATCLELASVDLVRGFFADRVEAYCHALRQGGESAAILIVRRSAASADVLATCLQELVDHSASNSTAVCCGLVQSLLELVRVHADVLFGHLDGFFRPFRRSLRSFFCLKPTLRSQERMLAILHLPVDAQSGRHIFPELSSVLLRAAVGPPVSSQPLEQGASGQLPQASSLVLHPSRRWALLHLLRPVFEAASPGGAETLPGVISCLEMLFCSPEWLELLFPHDGDANGFVHVLSILLACSPATQDELVSRWKSLWSPPEVQQTLTWPVVFTLLRCYPILPACALPLVHDVLRTNLRVCFQDGISTAPTPAGWNVSDDLSLSQLCRLVFRWAQHLPGPLAVLFDELGSTRGELFESRAREAFLGGLEAMGPADMWPTALIHKCVSFHEVKGAESILGEIHHLQHANDGVREPDSTLLPGSHVVLDRMGIRLRSQSSESAEFFRRCLLTPRAQLVLLRYLSGHRPSIALAVLQLAAALYANGGADCWDNMSFSIILGLAQSPNSALSEEAMRYAMRAMLSHRNTQIHRNALENTLWNFIGRLNGGTGECYVHILAELCRADAAQWVASTLSHVDEILSLALGSMWMGSQCIAGSIALRVLHCLYERYCNGNSGSLVAEELLRKSTDAFADAGEDIKGVQLAILATALFDPRPSLRVLPLARVRDVIGGAVGSSTHSSLCISILRQMWLRLGGNERQVITNALNMRARAYGFGSLECQTIVEVVKAVSGSPHV